ncbi:MAG: response regulator [Roseivirga sp.]|nr:response regulator [Roseivirga sp.]
MKAVKTHPVLRRLFQSLPVVVLLCFLSHSLPAQSGKPFVKSIKVSGTPASSASSVKFDITFNEEVTGVDKDDFIIEASQQLTEARISGLSGSGSSYVITISNIPENADGVISVDLRDSGTGIMSAARAVAGGFTQGLYHYAGAAFDVSRAVFAGDSESFSFTDQESHAFSLEFTPDGSKMFIMGFRNKTIYQYHLTTAFDISTATYTGDQESFSVFSQEINPRSLAFNLQGDKMFMIGSARDRVFEYTLSSPFDISTATYSGVERSFNIKKQGNFPYSMSFNNDGTKLFTAEMREANVNEYHLSRAFDVSTARYAGGKEKLSSAAQESLPVSLKFNMDGTRMYLLGNEENDINEYVLETPFDVSTASYHGDIERFSVADQDGDPRSVTFNGDGTKMFILGNGEDQVLEYVLDSGPLLLTQSSILKVVRENPANPPVEVIQDETETVQLTADEQNVVFQYQTNSTNQSDMVEYQTILEGAEEYWSAWTSDSKKEYSRLGHGTYTFKVKAHNRYGQESTLSELTFSIQRPWYFTFWAYMLYTAILITLIWRIVKFNTKRLEKEKKDLEKIVEQRTAEIATRMSEVEEANILIKEQADRLQELDKVKSRFFANISHELRTPLTLINAPLESLIENGKIEDEEVLKTLGVARKNGGSLLSLVEEILDLTKLEAGKLKLIENPVRLSEFVNDTLKGYETGFQKKSINLLVDFQPDDNLTVLMDANYAGKIVNNLLSNALKFTPEHGCIKVCVQYKAERPDLLQLSVEDNGEGIHPNDVKHIFDRFYQSEQPGQKAVGGTGIGLALAKELALLFEGDLKVESELGKGSMFSFEFPLKEVTEEVIVPLSKAETVSVDSALKETIHRYAVRFEVGKPVLLVTEDHPEMRAFIVQTLQPYFEIRQAENGKVALEILKAERIDIVLSDVMMPVMDGFELLESIKQDKSLHEVSLIMLTARADQEDKLFALTMGIDDYLTKPFHASEFLARIKNILENRIKILRELKGLEGAESGGFTADSRALMKTYDLSEREVEVIRLIAKRYSNPEIAEALHVSRNTVKTHLKNIYSKMDIRSRVEVTDKLSDFAEV